MGLLDGFFGTDINDPRSHGLLAMAAQLMGGRGNFGQNLGAGVQAGLGTYNDSRRESAQIAQAMFQLAEAQRKQQKDIKGDQATADYLEHLSMPQFAPGSTVMTAAGQDKMAAGPTNQFNPMEALRRGVPFSNTAALASFQPEAKAPLVTKPGDVLRDPRNPTRIIASNPGGDDGSGLAKLIRERDAFPVGHPARAVYDQMIQKTTTHQPATRVDVNMGQKGLDNELKVKQDFRSEPTYKVFQETKSAYEQIKAGLAQASPAGDLAAATKFMKLLDPGSVVRESELAMAMQASGAWDRLTNYAQMRVSGQKLTPDQRKDFAELADQLYDAAAEQYNSKRGEYAGFARDWGLNEDRTIGPAARRFQRASRTAVSPEVDAIVRKYLPATGR